MIWVLVAAVLVGLVGAHALQGDPLWAFVLAVGLWVVYWLTGRVARLREEKAMVFAAFKDQYRRKVSVEVAQHVLWFFGDRELGVEPGGWRVRLFELLAHSDTGNLERAAEAWPDLVFAFTEAKNEPDGMEWARSKVSIGRAVRNYQERGADRG